MESSSFVTHTTRNKSKSGDRIQGPKLQHFGKLNFTYHGKLRRHRELSTAAPSSTAAHLLRRRYLHTFEGSVAAVDQPQYTTEKKVPCVLWHLVYCGTSAGGIYVPQFESFYMVPQKWRSIEAYLLNTVIYTISKKL